MPAGLTLARPLAVAYLALLAYASLYPFTGWRAQDEAWLSFMWTRIAPPASRFDFFGNLVGYVPLGFLLGVWVVHTGRRGGAWAVAVLLPSVFSLGMEALQVYLPSRVPSRLDWLLNSAGGVIGVLLAAVAHGAGALSLWKRWRGRWFVADAHGALVLLVLWPCALLYPSALPFGLGQVWHRINAGLAQLAEGTPLAGWWVVGGGWGEALSPSQVAVGVGTGLLVPCLLGFSVLRQASRRLLHGVAVLALGVGMTGLSSALSHGPQHAWVWWTPPTWVGVALAGGLALLMSGLSRRAALVWMLLAQVVSLFLLHRLPEVPYLAESQDAWAQGRFIRFYGLTQWLGWVWPYLLLWHGLWQVGRRRPPADPQAPDSR